MGPWLASNPLNLTFTELWLTDVILGDSSGEGGSETTKRNDHLTSKTKEETKLLRRECAAVPSSSSALAVDTGCWAHAKQTQGRDSLGTASGSQPCWLKRTCLFDLSLAPPDSEKPGSLF